jgi:hypothetical protein
MGSVAGKFPPQIWQICTDLKGKHTRFAAFRESSLKRVDGRELIIERRDID